MVAIYRTRGPGLLHLIQRAGRAIALEPREKHIATHHFSDGPDVDRVGPGRLVGGSASRTFR